VHAVVDHLEQQPRIVQGGTDRTRVAVMERPHPVEQVGRTVAPASAPAIICSYVASVWPSAATAPASTTWRIASSRSAARRDRHHLHSVAEYLRDVLLDRVAEQRRLMGSAPGRREERTFEVDAGDHAVGDQFGQAGGLIHELVKRSGDQARHRRGGAVPGVEGRDLAGLLGVVVEYVEPPPPCVWMSTKPGTTVTSPRSSGRCPSAGIPSDRRPSATMSPSTTWIQAPSYTSSGVTRRATRYVVIPSLLRSRR